MKKDTTQPIRDLLNDLSLKTDEPEPISLSEFNSNNPELILKSTTAINKFISKEVEPPIKEVIQSGIVPRLVKLLLTTNDHPKIQFEIASILTKIASGSTQQTRVIIDNGVVPVFVLLLNSPHGQVVEKVVEGLGNIAGDSYVLRDLVLSNNGLQPILNILQDPSTKLSLARLAVWTLSNFCRGKPQAPFEIVKTSLPTLAKLIYCQDEEILIDVCWTLSYLSDGTHEKIQHVLDINVCKRLVELLSHPSLSIQTASISVIGKILSGDENQVNTALGCNVLPHLFTLLHSPNKKIAREACCSISNITAGNEHQIRQVIDANIILPLIKLMENGNTETKKEAAWAIANVTGCGTPQQVQFLVEQGCIKSFVDLLNLEDPRIIMVSLEALENILSSGLKLSEDLTVSPYAELIQQAGGFDLIAELQCNENRDIYKRSMRIIETFFDHNTDDE